MIIQRALEVDVVCYFKQKPAWLFYPGSIYFAKAPVKQA